MGTYAIGIDYGTLSGRALLVDLQTGEEKAEAVYAYPHGVMDRTLPNGTPLPPEYALQHPNDYLEVLRTTVPAVLQKVGVRAEEVAGLCIDFTACTLLPVDENGLPLCMKAAYADEKHAYVKLWKHHAAQPEADEINALAAARGEKWLPIYGGKISPEWAIPKILEILREAPDVYHATHRFIEAADWLSFMLTGEESHSAVFAGYKALWNAEDGYPSNEFFKALDPRLDGIVGTKLSQRVRGMDQMAGLLNAEGARLTGLCKGMPVALPMIDAHAAMPAAGITQEGELLMIVGTSTCHIVHAKQKAHVEGICGYVRDGVIPHLYTYEAGQAAVGDSFDWVLRTCIPASYTSEAEVLGIGLHRLLREKASRLAAGESRLLALDWFNGNRSVLVNSNLKGMILGLDLQTKPEEIYRAIIESTAFGARVIVEQYEKSGIAIKRISAAGGIAQKDEMMMQIYADVLGREIRIVGTAQAGALGSAIYASVAAGVFSSVAEASARLSKPACRVFYPNEKNQAVYNGLYREYKKLHDYFGAGEGLSSFSIP